MGYISPDDPNTVYFSEQEYEEIKLRKQHQEALDQAAKEAKANAEAEIQAQKTKALTEFETGLEAQAPTEQSIKSKIADKEAEIRADFRKKIDEARTGSVEERSAKIKVAREDFANKMATAREEFKKQKATVLERFQKEKGETETRFQGQLRSLIPTIKREYAMSQGTQFTPRQIIGYRKQQVSTLQSQMQSEAERLGKDIEAQSKVFEEGLTGEAVGYESELAEYEKSEKATVEAHVKTETESFEQSLTEWRTQVKKDLGSTFAPWKEEQLKGYKGELESWEKEAKATAEADVKSWAKSENKTFDEQVDKWRDAWQDKSFSEQILDVKPYFPEELRGLELGIREVVKVGAGVIGAGESLTYGLGGLIGFKTPRMPPTLTGGLITSGIESILSGGLKQSAELQKMGEYGVSYAVGSVLGDVALSIGIGAVYEKFAPAPIKSVVTRITSPIEKGIGKATSFVTKPVRSAWSGSSAEKWLFSKSDWYAKQVAKSIAPSTAYLPQLDRPYDFTMKAGLPTSTKLIAEQFAWDQMMWGYERGIKMSRTALIGLGSKPSAMFDGGEIISAYMQRSLPHLVARGGQISTGYLKAASSEPVSFKSFSKALNSLPSSRGMMSVSVLVQPLLEPKTIIEPMMRIPVEIMKKAALPTLASEIFGAGVIAGVKTLSLKPTLRVLEPVKPVERLKSSPLQVPSMATFLFQLPRSEAKVKTVLRIGSAQALGLGQIASQIQGSLQSQLSALSPRMMNIAKSVNVIPRPRKIEDILGLSSIPKALRKTSKRKQEYLYPIRSVGSVAKLVFGKPTKNKRK